MTQHYLECHFGDSEEGAFLLGKVIKGIHSFIVFEIGEHIKQQSKIAVAPIPSTNQGYDNLTGLRIFGDKQTLEKLLRYPVLLRYLNDFPVSIKQVPPTTEWAAWYRDRTGDRNSPSRMRRHEKRGYKRPKAPPTNNRFYDIQIQSDKNGQQFVLRMACTPADKLDAPLFNSYGLAVRGLGATPVF